VANRFKGDVSFDAGGKSYTMRFSANALCELEDATGMGINALLTILADPAKMRLKMVRAVLWAGLQDHHPDVTLHQAGEIITDLSLTKAMDLAGKSFELAFQDTSKSVPPKPGKSPAKLDETQAGTGLVS
jgi:hypothetical protein